MARPAPASPVLATAIVDQLKAVGVKRLFGIPGGGSSLALIEAAGRAGLEFILTRTETAAAASSLGGDVITVQFSGPRVVEAAAEALANWGLTVNSTSLDLTGSTFVLNTMTQELVITRTWTATDACGNQSSCEPMSLTIASTTRSTFTAVRALTTTCAPSRANRRAMASPIPWPAPVTMATLPASRVLLDSSISPSLHTDKLTYVIRHD